MRRTVQVFAAATLAATLTLVGCTESSIPSNLEEEAAFFSHEPAPGFSVILRDAPLPTTLQASAVLGSGGGIVDLPEAGVRLVVPAGALDGATEITLAARAGGPMAFELAPEGLELRAAATLEVDVSGASPTSLWDDFLGVAFEGDREGPVEPVGILRAHRDDDVVTIEFMTLLAGYATASG